jgi:glycosyltransferase involved in cell wall biosynthesis
MPSCAAPWARWPARLRRERSDERPHKHKPPSLKILYHHRTASKDGQAVHIEEMITALRDQGHEVHVVAPSISSDDGMGAEVGWVHSLRARLPQAVYELLELGYSIVAYRHLAKAAKEFRPDVLYERCNLFLIAGVLLKRRLKIPMLLEVNSPLTDERLRHDGLGLPALARWSERYVWRGADVVLPVTRVLADIVEREGVQPGRVLVVPNGINEAHFAQAPSVAEAKARLGWQDALVLGFTGFVRDWHGVDRVLHWLASADAPPHARLLVVGDGPARVDLEALAQSLGLGERVRFTGVVARSAVPSYVAAFDIALQPAVTSYASPLKLFEYLALGKAILAPRVPNIEEVLKDGHNALLFDAKGDAKDDASFTHALTRLSQDETLRRTLAVEAKNTVTSMGLTWSRNATRVTQRAQALLTQQRGDPAPAAGRA